MTTKNFANSQTPNTPLSFRNKIINGNFDIWQRGVSQTTSGYGSDDRWTNVLVSSTATFSRQSFALYDASAPQGSTYFARTVVTTAGTATSACNKTQRIEGVRTLAGKTITVSFWAKADTSRAISVDLFQYFGSGGSPSSTVEGIGATKFAVTSSWQKFTLSVTLPTLSGKTLGTDGKDCLALRIWFDAGSNYNTQTASLGNQSGTFDISQVQVEEGSVATPFEQRPVGLELSLCQRYYQTISASFPVVGFTDCVTACVPLACSMRTEYKNLAGTNNITDGNFTTAGAPAGSQWGLQRPGVVAASKTGTFVISQEIRGAYYYLLMYGITLSVNVNYLQNGWSALPMDCEL